jgi:hypothetical protein
MSRCALQAGQRSYYKGITVGQRGCRILFLAMLLDGRARFGIESNIDWIITGYVWKRSGGRPLRADRNCERDIL